MSNLQNDAENATMQERSNQPSEATLRALKRVEAGEKPTLAAKAENIHPSTVFRALARKRPSRLFLVIAKERGGYNAWIENQRYKQQGQDTQFGSATELVSALPGLLEKC